MADMSVNTPVFAGVPAQPSLFRRAVARLVRMRTFRATVTELNALSERNLADIGLDRKAITERARQAGDRASALYLQH